eukprot:6485671-Amphidinium_carterae.1
MFHPRTSVDILPTSLYNPATWDEERSKTRTFGPHGVTEATNCSSCNTWLTGLDQKWPRRLLWIACPPSTLQGTIPWQRKKLHI